jgi:hypothetical protein
MIGGTQATDNPYPNSAPPNTNPTENGPVFGNISPKPSKHHRKALLFVVVGLALLVVGSLAYLVLNKKDNQHKANQSNSAAYKIPGSQAGRGLTFSAPFKLTAWYDKQTDTRFKSFQYYATDPLHRGQTANLARIAASADDYSAQFAVQEFLNGIKDNLKADPDSASFKRDTKPLKDFVQSAYTDTDIEITLGAIKVFTNPNIKHDAYAYTLSGIDPTKKIAEQSGIALWISGPKTYYHFVVMADAKDWQKNLGSYQQVLDSIKIDQ